MSKAGEVKIKMESGDSSAAASAGANPPFRPKFVPKIPSKAATPPPEEPAPAAPPASEPAQSSSYRVHKFEKKGGRLHKNADRAGGRSGRGAQASSGSGPGTGGSRAGRGQWSMPMGTSFFTGNASAQLAKTRNNTVSGVGSSSSSSSAAIGIKVEGSQARIARPNEDTALVDQDLPAALFRDRDIRPTDDSDSDASADATGGNGRIEEGREVWPPRQLDPLAPVQLPLGPATVAMRRHLATQPILADPSDPAALEHEELASLFLVQLPSTLNLPQPSSAATAPARSVGKMRLHRSGRVSLVTPEGQVYNVNTGLAASFQQCLMSVHLAASEGPAAGGAALASSSTSSAPASGSLCLMGQVTKKLVVTPTVQDYMLSLQNDRRGTGAQSGEKMERVEADSGEEAEAVLVEDG